MLGQTWHFSPCNFSLRRFPPEGLCYLPIHSPTPAPTSVLKLDSLASSNINHPTLITPPLLLILLLREALPLRHAQILMCPIGIVVRAVRVRRHLRVYTGVVRNALEGRVLFFQDFGGFGFGGWRGRALSL